MPAPGEYTKQQLNRTFMQAMRQITKKDQTAQFISKKKRFEADDTLPPGPGQYKLPESCSIREPKHRGATYRSSTKRELGNHGYSKNNHILTKGPGIGSYDLTGFNAIGGQTMPGGGAVNNFTIHQKDLTNPAIRKVEPKESPRIPPTVAFTPQALGPGTYAIDPSSKRVEEKFKPSKIPKRDANWDSIERFRSLQPQTSQQIGPGTYKVGQKWTKRTYNLKFLDSSKQDKNSGASISPSNKLLSHTLAQNSSPNNLRTT